MTRKVDEWRDTTYGEMYDLVLGNLEKECTEFKTLCTSVPSAGDMSIDKYVESIKSMVDKLRSIKSAASLIILRRKLDEQ